MFDSITKIVRSNQNGVMFRIGNGSPETAVYSIYDLATQQHSATGSLNMVKKAWNRNYRNSRQFVAKGNHRYIAASV
jgi:hypothetical protein